MNGQDGTLTRPAKFYRFSIEIAREFQFTSTTADYCAGLQLVADNIADTPEQHANGLRKLGLLDTPLTWPTPVVRIASKCGHELNDEPVDAELCYPCIRQRIAALAPKAPIGVRPPSFPQARKPVAQQTVRAIKAATSCVHNFDIAACPFCRPSDGVPLEVGF